MIIDRSVCPDVEPPTAVTSPVARADYVHRICAAFDCGVFPEETDWATFAGALRPGQSPTCTKAGRMDAKR